MVKHRTIRASAAARASLRSVVALTAALLWTGSAGAQTLPAECLSGSEVVHEVRLRTDTPGAKWLLYPCEVESAVAPEAAAEPPPGHPRCRGGGCPECPDFTEDGMVDGADLGILLAAWGPCDPVCTLCPADLNDDDVVDVDDMLAFLAMWGMCR